MPEEDEAREFGVDQSRVSFKAGSPARDTGAAHVKVGGAREESTVFRLPWQNKWKRSCETRADFRDLWAACTRQSSSSVPVMGA